MKKVLFCKYNTNRASMFQTKTLICSENDELYIEKKAMFEEGVSHIESFEENYVKAKDIYPRITLLPTEKVDGGIRYPYISGKSIDEILEEVTTWDGLFEKINELRKTYLIVNEENYCEFEKEDEFLELFGDVDCTGFKAIKPCNLDMTFDNIVITPEGNATAFDYEWVCGCAVPEVYVDYRLFRRLFDRYYNYLSVRCSFDEFLSKFGYNEKDISLCEKLEEGFLSYVFKGGNLVFPPEQYLLKRIDFTEVRNKVAACGQTTVDYNNALHILHDTEKKYLDTIENLNNAVRIKEEVEDKLHDTEKKYLDTIDNLNTAVKIKEEVEDKLHDTEKKYLDTIENLNNAVRIKEEVEDKLHDTEKKYLDTIDNLNTAVKVKEEVEDLLHDTEKKYLDTIDNLNTAVRIKGEVEDLLHDTEKKYLETIENLNNTAQKCAVLENENNDLKHRLDEMCLAYDRVIKSKSWKLTKPIRGINKLVYTTRKEGVKSAANKVATRLGVKKNQETVINQEPASKQISPFWADIEVSKEELDRQRNTIFDKQPLISVITPLFNTPEKYLVDLLESLKEQTYGNWQFCLVDFSDKEHGYVNEICVKYAEADARYDYHVGKENRGISDNTNECISYAKGEYIGLLDHDDILHKSALYEVVKVINEEDSDFIYTDEIKFEEDIRESFAPNFKPDFSADELRAHNFICHFCVYSTDFYRKYGGYRREFDGSQDHDIVLRLTEKAKKITHIPKILYFWRVHPGSVASGIEAKSYATKSGENAVTEQFERLGVDQYAESVINNIPLYRFKSNNKVEYSFDVLVWDIKDAEDTDRCRQVLDSYKGSIENIYYVTDGIETLQLKEGEQHIYKGNRSYGEVWNELMKSSESGHILLLNAKVQQLSNEMIQEFGLYIQRNDIGVIDVKILNKDNIISGGLYLCNDKNMPVKVRCIGGHKDYFGYENAMLYARDVSCALPLCALINKNIWKELNGFNEDMDSETMIEYSYRAMKGGYHNIWTPFVQADIAIDNEEIITLLCKKNGVMAEDKDSYISKKVFDNSLE